MNIRDFREIEELVSQLHDDGLSAAQFDRLEELLLDSPEAQAHYWGLVNSHIGLTAAHNPQNRPATSSYSLPSVAWRLAAALLVGVTVFLLYQSTGGVPQQTAIAESSSNTRFGALPVVTRVTWEGPCFESQLAESQPAPTTDDYRSGTIRLSVDPNMAADGYLFCLEPGCSVDLLSTFDATGENSLSLVELHRERGVAVNRITFHNSGEGPRPRHANPLAIHRRYGVLGHWSETNFSSEPRYFLLTGVHKLATTIGSKEEYTGDTEQWRMSQMCVLLENTDVVHIGWDDSGPYPAENQGYNPDYDFDDLAATLFFSSGTSQPTPGFQVVSDFDSPQLQVPDVADQGGTLSVAPGEKVIFKTVYSAKDPNALVLIDDTTGELLWASQQPTKDAYPLSSACIENTSDAIRQLRFVGVHRKRNQPADDPRWHVSHQRKLYEQRTLFIVGYDDGIQDGDFNDLRVTAFGSVDHELNLLDTSAE